MTGTSKPKDYRQNALEVKYGYFAARLQPGLTDTEIRSRLALPSKLTSAEVETFISRYTILASSHEGRFAATGAGIRGGSGEAIPPDGAKAPALTKVHGEQSTLGLNFAMLEALKKACRAPLVIPTLLLVTGLSAFRK